MTAPFAAPLLSLPVAKPVWQPAPERPGGAPDRVAVASPGPFHSQRGRACRPASYQRGRVATSSPLGPAARFFPVVP